jgi:hypothetical protein
MLRFAEITEPFIGAAIAVHRELGPGLLESIYEAVHRAQLLSYMRVSNKPVGLLVNYRVPVLIHGIERMVLGLDDPGKISASP